MSCIYPASENLSSYWETILQQVNAITETPKSRWSIDDYFGDTQQEQDKTYSKFGGFIPDINFDPIEFGLPPNILETTDVSQLLSLKVAKATLEDSGYSLDKGDISTQKTFDSDRVGVVLGGGGLRPLAYNYISRLQYPVWRKVLKTFDFNDADIEKIVSKFQQAYVDWQEHSFPGYLGNVIAGRVANRLDLRGINCMTDAACASSLAAVNLAIAELAAGKADLMLTGGVDLDNSPMRYLSFSHTGAFSKKGDMRPFDEDSDGMLTAEGIGMIAVKRLEDAEREGDRIYAVIKGVGCSSDGKSKSIYAPSPEGQALSLHSAYRHARVDPKNVELIEAHGTGTAAGDAAELSALVSAFKEKDTASIALGSVKSQIGHAKAAAGAAGLIKTALALYHKVLPPTIKVTRPNPKLKLHETPFYVNTEARPWFRQTAARRTAGVSAFGFGGTNYHVVLEEYEADAAGARTHTVPASLLIAANDKAQLIARCREHLQALSEEDGSYYFQTWGESCDKSASDTQARLGFVADSAVEAAKKLTSALSMLEKQDGEWSHPQGIYFRPCAPFPDGKLVVMFSGQGAQYVNMGRDLLNNFPCMQDMFCKLDASYKEASQTPLSSIAFPQPVFSSEAKSEQENVLASSVYNGPSVAAFGAGLYQLFTNSGLKPDFLMGHSFGEITALWAAGVLDEEGFCQLVRKRAELTAPENPQTDYGVMLAVNGDIEKYINEIKAVDGIQLANFNSSQQLVVGLAKAAVATVTQQLEAMGLTVKPLSVEVAFHTSFIQHAVEPFREVLANTAFGKAAIPVYSNVTAGLYTADVANTLLEQLQSPVLFKQQLENLYEQGARFFLEISPRVILSNFVRDSLQDKPHFAISTVYSRNKSADTQLRDAIVQLRVAGVEVPDIDLYRKAVGKAPLKESNCTVPLNGGGYVSPKSQEKIDRAFTEKTALTSAPVTRTSTPLAGDKVDTLLSVNDHQIETLKTHQTFLELQGRYLDAIKHLGAGASLPHAVHVKEETPVASTPEAAHTTSAAPAANLQAEIVEVISEKTGYPPEMLDVTMDLEADLGIDSIKLVEIAADIQSRLLSGITVDPEAMAAVRSVRDLVALVENLAQDNHVASPSDTAVAAGTLLSKSALSEALLKLVSEKTGYPAEMLDLDMNLEADLGIDSIKSVEVFDALARDLMQQGVTLELEDFAGLETLSAVIERVLEQAAKRSVSPPAIEKNGTPAVSSLAVASVEMQGSEAAEKVLAEISARTGYPPEVLDPDMNLEADLGIDSIKMVEIVSALAVQFSSLAQASEAELTQLASVSDLVSLCRKTPRDQTEQLADDTPLIVREDTQESSGSSVAAEHYAALLTGIISQMTGYPENTIEADMDLESDLGIDSIKKVEILSTFQSEINAQISAEALEGVSLPSINAIIEFVSSQSDLAHETQHKNEPESTIEPSDTPAIQYFPVALRQLSPLPVGNSLSTNAPCLLVSDTQNEFLHAVTEKMQAHGLRTYTLMLPGALDEASLAAQCDGVLANSDEWAGVVCLVENQEQGSVYFHSTQEDKLAQHVMVIQRVLSRLTQAGKGFVSVVMSLDGALGYSEPVAPDLAFNGAYCGLIKSLAAEYEPLNCRVLDMSPALSAKEKAERLWLELQNPDEEQREVAWCGDVRFSLAVEENKSNFAASTSAFSIPESEVFLVSGGARGITAECVIELAKRYKCTFLLAGRSPVSIEIPDWFSLSLDERSANALIVQHLFQGKAVSPKQLKTEQQRLRHALEIQQTLKALQGFGSSVEYLEADILNGDAVSVIKAACEKHGGVTGIVHGAGIIEDALFLDKTLESFQRVVAVKLQGLVNLLACADLQKLRYLTLFSSTAGFYGNRGQADYAAANEAMNKFALTFSAQYPQCRVRSINWGPWDSGMVSPALKKQYQARNIPLIPLADGARIFADLMASDAPEVQVVVGRYRTARKHITQISIDHAKNPFLGDHAIAGNPVLPATCAAYLMLNACEKHYPGFQFAAYRDFKVLKGLTFAERAVHDLSLEISETQVNDDSVRCNVLVQSQQGMRPLYHYRAEVELKAQAQTPPTVTFSANAFTPQKTGATYYQKRVLFHGPSFQGVTHILHLDKNKVVTRCRVNRASAEQYGQIDIVNFNPFIADVAGHGVLIWAYENLAKGCLPASLQEFTHYKTIDFEEDFYVTVYIRSQTQSQLITDVYAHDEHGVIYFKRVGSVMTLSTELLRKYAETEKALVGEGA